MSYLNASHPFTVTSTLAAQRIVAAASGGNACQYPASTLDTQVPLGITLDTVKETSTAIAVAVSGVAKLYFNDTCATGTLVTSDTSGRGIPYVAVSIGGAYVGILIGPSVALTGTVAEVLIRPGMGTSA